jgi:alkylation response protein AidB-like acyl-CoA dehydrogenase
MDLALSDEQETLREAARAFLGRAWPPDRVREVRAAGGDGHDPDLWREIASLGWLGLPFPTSVGGGGGDLVDLAVVFEEAGRALAPTTFATAIEALLVLDRAADDDQRAALLPDIVGGRRLASVAVDEEHMRASASAIETVADDDSDAVVVRGTKLFVPDAGVADDLVVVACDGSASAPDGVRIVVVPTSAPGLASTPLATFAGDAQHVVSFDGVRVPRSHVLTAPRGAWAALTSARRDATALQCVEMTGGARAVLEMTVAYVTDRVQFGRPIGSFQAVQHHVADLSTRIDAASLAAWQAVWRCAAGADAERYVNIAKAAAVDAYVGATLIGHQLHGAIGFVLDHDLHLWSDRARAAANRLGTRDDHLRALSEHLATGPRMS